MTAEPSDSVPGQLDAIYRRMERLEDDLRSFSEAVPVQFEHLSNRLDSEEMARMQLTRTLEDVALRQRALEHQLGENTALTRLVATTAEASAKRVDDAVTKISGAADTLSALHKGRVWLSVSHKLLGGIIAALIAVGSALVAWDKIDEWIR